MSEARQEIHVNLPRLSLCYHQLLKKCDFSEMNPEKVVCENYPVIHSANMKVGISQINLDNKIPYYTDRPDEFVIIRLRYLQNVNRITRFFSVQNIYCWVK